MAFNSAFAINHRDEIAKAQTWVNSMKTNYPILIFNQDEVNFLFASHGAFSEESKELRFELLKSYVKEKTSVDLKRSELEDLMDHILNSNLPAAVTILDDKFTYSAPSAENFKLCAVFPAVPNGTTRSEIERLTGLYSKDAYPQRHFDQLTERMTREEMYLFTLYHETGHCLDTLFLPAATGSSSDPHDIHMAEAFAETFAYLALSERFGVKLAETRAVYRTLYSRKLGEFFAQDFSGAYGDKFHLNAGAIYNLGPYLMHAYQKVRFKKVKPNPESPESLVKLAYKLLDEKHFDFRTIAAISMGLTYGLDVVLEEYKEEAFKSPEYFFFTYTELMEYKMISDLMIEKSFDLSIEPFIHDQEAPTLPQEAFCSAINNKDSALFDATLNGYREALNQGQFEYQSVAQRVATLHKLGSWLNENCGMGSFAIAQDDN